MTVFRTAWEAACATPHVARADETPTVQVATVLVPSASSSARGLALVPPPSWRQGLGGLAPAPTVPSRAAARHPNVGRRDDGAESLMLSVSNPICQGYQNQRRHQQQEPFNRQALVDVENVIQRCAGMRAQR